MQKLGDESNGKVFLWNFDYQENTICSTMLHQKLKTMGSNQQSENLKENNEKQNESTNESSRALHERQAKAWEKMWAKIKTKKNNGGGKKSNIEGNGGAKKNL